MNDLFIKTMKKLQENRRIERNSKVLNEDKHVDLEGEEKDIVTVIDPDLSTKEFKEKQQEVNDIINNTPEGENVVDTEYVGMKIYTCPLCLSNFYSEVEMDDEAQCPVCFETPDKFVYLGTIEQAASDSDEEAVEKAEQELDNSQPDEETDGEDEYELVDDTEENTDEDEEQRLIASKSIDTKGKVINEDLEPEDIIDLTDINNKLNNAESIDELSNIIIIIPNETLKGQAQAALDNCTNNYNFDVPYVASKIQEALKSNIVNEDQYENERRKGKPNVKELAQEIYDEEPDWYDEHIKDYKNANEFIEREIAEIASEWNLREQTAKAVCAELYNMAFKKLSESKILTEGGIYPVDLDEGAEEAFENKVGEILGGDVSVSNLELIPAKGFGGSGIYWFRATINVSDPDIIDKFINENTPTAKLLNDNNELIISSYSDISIEDDKYDSGITFDCSANCQLEFNIDDLDEDADKVGDAIIQKLRENQETLINLLKDYEVIDEEEYDDIEESKELKESDEENGIIELGNDFQTILDKDTNSYIVLYRGSEIDSSLKDDEYYEACKTLDGIKNFVKKLKIQTTGKGFAKKSRIVKESDESIKPEDDNGDYNYFYSPRQIIEICEDKKYEHTFDEEFGTIEELEKELQDIKRIESEKPITTIEEPLTDRYPGWKNCKVKTILKDGREFVSEEDTLSVWSAVQLVVADEVMKESPQQVPGTEIKRKNNEEKLDEAKLTDYLNQQELDRLIRQNPVLKNVMKSYKVLDNMILEVTTDMGISYYKAVLNDNGELELYWISKDGKKLGDPFLLSEACIEEVNNNCDDCWIMIEDCKKLNEEAEAEGFKYNNKEYTGLDTYTYTFTLDQEDEFEKAKEELAKTGTVTEIFINNGYGLEYKKDRNI